MKMYNFEVENFGLFLTGMNMTNGKQSRMRTRFIRLLTDRLNVIKAEIHEIVKKHADKDEAGEPKYNVLDEATGKIDYIVEDLESLEKEINDLWNEELVIEEGEDIRNMLITVRNGVLDYEGDLSGGKAILYDRFCEIVENVLQNPKEKNELT